MQVRGVVHFSACSVTPLIWCLLFLCQSDEGRTLVHMCVCLSVSAQRLVVTCSSKPNSKCSLTKPAVSKAVSIYIASLCHFLFTYQSIQLHYIA